MTLSRSVGSQPASELGFGFRLLLGGLVSSLVVALFLLPAAYLHLVPQQADEAPPPHEEEPEAVAVGTAF